MKKKILSLLLIAALVVTLTTATLAYGSTPREPGEISADGFFVLDYTKTIFISSLNGLNALADLTNGDDNYDANNLEGWLVILTRDIGDKQNGFTGMISYAKYPYFQGTFDGAGHTVTLDIDNTTGNYTGLFSYLGSNGTIKNVHTAGTVNSTSSDVGAVCGFNYGGIIENCTNSAEVSSTSSYVGGICGFMGYGENRIIRNCSNNGTISGQQYIGGICGRIDNGAALVENCSNSGMISGKNSYVGGICGEVYANNTIMENCTNSGSVSNSAGTDVGGICGDAYADVINCHNSGRVVSTLNNVGGVCGTLYGNMMNCTNSGSVSSSSYNIGGIVGNYPSGTKIENCHNSGNVEVGVSTNGNGFIGGVCGNGSAGVIVNCYNTGNVTAPTHYTVGGISGCGSSNVQNCYNKGAITGGEYAGGVCGSFGGSIMENTYSCGKVRGTNYAGGVCGQLQNGKTVKNSYFDQNRFPSVDPIGQDNGGTYEPDNVKGLTTTECTRGTLLGLLNDYRAEQEKEDEWNQWYRGIDGYPVFKGSEDYDDGTQNPILPPREKSPNPIEVAHVENGTVTRSVTSAKVNGVVTFTVTPEPGFEVAKVYVTNRYSDKIPLKDQGDGEYSFKMPDVAVTIYAEFAEIDAPIEDEPVIEPEPVFDDVTKGDYYAGAVDWAVEKGITNGLSATAFGPDEVCTRAQAVTLLWRMAGCPEVELSDKFTDVEAGSYYEMAVSWAIENGITLGTSETTFSPDMLCSRAHIVTFLLRYADGVTENTNNPFTDVEAGEYYEVPVLWAVEKEITTGKTATRFAPNDDCTRGQIVTFLWRLAAK